MNKTIIFDYDGVIVDSLDVFMNLFIKACHREGETQMQTKKDFLQLFKGNMFEQMMKQGMTKEKILRIVYQVRDGLLIHQSSISPCKGIKEALEKLSNHHQLFIITSNDTRVVEVYLQLNHLDYFHDIIGSDKEASKVKKIQRILTNSTKNITYYIGDTVGDIIEGKKAGIQTIGVTWGWHTETQLQKVAPDYLIDTPDELFTIL